MDLFLFHPFVTKVPNSEDLNVISNESKCALLLHMSWLRTRERGQSALKLPCVAAALEALHTKLLLKGCHIYYFTLNLCSRLGVFHSETQYCVKNGEDSMLNNFNCKSKC